MTLINFAGLASGIDSTALIKAQVDALRRQRVTPLTTKVTESEEMNAALETFKEKLEDLRSKASIFNTISGGGVSKTATSSNDARVSATASSSAANGVYSINVTSKAKNAVLSLDDRFSSSSAVINSSINNGDPAANRRVSVTVGTGSTQETVNVDLTNTTTVSEFVNTFNSTATKAQASLVNVSTSGSPSFAIVISSKKEGVAEGFLGVSVGSSITGSGSGAFTANTLDQATNAQLTVSGITGTITRATNSINDVITGVTFDVLDTGAATVTVGDDASTTTTKVQEFVDSYNDIIKFLNENNTIERDESGNEVRNIFAALAGSQTDESAFNTIRSALSTTSFAGGSSVRILADLGITTERDGTLKFNSTEFSSALSRESSSVASVLANLGDTLSLTGGVIDLITRFNGSLDTTLNSNKDLIKNYNERISDAEASIAEQESALRARFARLESQISRLQSQQSSLSSALSSLR
jgi:flagellar hook-associated protein 2